MMFGMWGGGVLYFLGFGMRALVICGLGLRILMCWGTRGKDFCDVGGLG